MGNTTPFTTSRRFNPCKDLKQTGLNNFTLLRDLTAYAGPRPVTRGRSFHTRGRAEKLLQDSKGSSLEQKSQTTKVLKKQKVSALTPYKVRKAGKPVSLVTLVQKELQLYENSQGIYNGLINILKKPEFLVSCYEAIRGKPGNMTKGTTEETLDGLT